MSHSAHIVAIFFAAAIAVAAAVGCNGGEESSPAQVDQGAEGESAEDLHAVEIRASRELGTLRTRVGEEEFAGVECATCHAMEVEGPTAHRPDELDEFHTGMQMDHGDLSCDSCHNPDDRSTLRLADGEALEFADTRQLCAQCHGPQHRDYMRGSHGGMSGYWDLSKGGRTRNDCVNCHDPHEPAFPSMQPAEGPTDTAKEVEH